MRYIRLLKFLYIGFSLCVLNAYANIFAIEDEQDLRGIANTFSNFYCKNWENLLAFQQDGFKKGEAFSSIILELKTSESPLYTSYLQDKKIFRSSFLTLKCYIKQNAAKLKEQLGEKKYNHFIGGVFYTQQILKKLR